MIGSAAFIAATGARAADMLPPPLMPAPQPVYANGDFSGWYLRGDIGVGISGTTEHKSTFAAGSPAIPGFATVATSLESAAFAGFGLGYKVNNWFRADVTGEFRSMVAYNSLNAYTGTAPGCIECYDQYRANFGGGVFLANGYVDLGTWAGVTPFIGAGIGGSYNIVKDITDHNVTTGTGFGYGKGESKFNFAWALMAGLAYNVNQNLTLEMGYRYLDRGKAETGAISCANGAGGCFFERQSFRATSHDLRFGMRWQFADTPLAPMQAPLIRKY
ncbi:MAG: outer membrane beta-barrel protein [Beijerinckiaceae bacterium]|nr:outer membrane beta-barrel protein [Beijerinckiaceae bacterium]